MVQGVLQVMQTCPEIVEMHLEFSKLHLIQELLWQLVHQINKPRVITKEVRSLVSSLELVGIQINRTNH